MSKSQEIIDFGWDGYLAELEKDTEFVDVGVLAQDGAKKLPKGDITMATLASVQEFGHIIKHPGGTSFGFKTKKDLESGKISFLKKGKGVFEAGVTRKHDIVIPSRPFMRQTFDEQEQALAKLADDLEFDILTKGTSKRKALSTLGTAHRDAIKRNMKIEGKFERNAPSTIRKKKSSNELIDKGLLRGAIQYEVG